METIKRDNLILLLVLVGAGLLAVTTMFLTNPVSMWLSLGLFLVVYWVPVGLTMRWYSKKWPPKESESRL